MIRPAKLGAVATVAALGASLATPGISAAVADTSPSPIDPTTLTSSLTGLLGSSQAQAVETEIEAMDQSGATTALLTELQTTLSSLLGDLGTTLSNTITDLLGTNDPNQALVDLEAGLTALQSDANLNAQQAAAAAELAGVLSDEGLSTLFADISSGDATDAITELTALAQASPGATIANGDLQAVAAELTALAADVPNTAAASTLTTVAGLLNSGTGVTPQQLQTAITQLQSITSTTTGGTTTIPTTGTPLDGIIANIVTALGQSGSIFGQLTATGSSVPSTVTNTAMSQLADLPTSAPGTPDPLSAVATILNTIATTNGVSGTPAASVLTTAASALSNPSGTDPTALLSTITALQGLSSSSLPAPLNTLVSDLTSQLSASGSVLGTLSGLSSTAVSQVLSELTTLASLARGASVPALPGVAAVFQQLAGMSPFAGTQAATILNEVASGLSSGGLTGASLDIVAEILNDAAGAVPAPLSTTLGGLASALGESGSRVSGTGTSTSSTGSGSGGSSSTRSGSGSGSTSTSANTANAANAANAALIALARRFDWGLLTRSVRHSNRVTVTLYCYAQGEKTCTDTMKATASGYRTVARTVRLGAGRTGHYTLTLKAKPAKRGARKVASHNRRRPAIKLAVTSGRYRVIKTLK